MELDRLYKQQEAVKRYILLKKLKQPELTLDDKLFIENFRIVCLFSCGDNPKCDYFG